MLNEKLKSYMQCKDCWKSDNCTYYQDVKYTIERFKNTPLNIHFPYCNEFESYFYKFTSNIEAVELSEEDKKAMLEYFNKDKDKVTKIIMESLTKHMLDVENRTK